MKREWHIPLPGRVFCFLTGRPYNAPWQRFVRKKRLQSLIAYDPIICEYKWSDTLSDNNGYYRFYYSGEVSFWYMDGFYQWFKLSNDQVAEIESAIEKSKVYLLPEKINANALDGVFQTLVFFDSKANPITEIGGQNPCLVSKRFNDFTDLLSGIIEPHIKDIPNQEMRYDLFDPKRRKMALAEAQEDLNVIIQSIIEERD